MKKTITLIALSAVSLAAYADYYRTGNADSDWSNFANWTTDSEGTNPATTIPGTSGAQGLFINAAGNGTTTVFTGAYGNLTFGAFEMKAANLEFSGANVMINGNFKIADQYHGTVDARISNSVTIGNGSSVSTNTFLVGMTKATSYADITLDITGNSTLTIRGGGWADFKLIDGENSTAKLFIEKGSSLIATGAANLSLIGSHSNAANSVVVADIAGYVSMKELDLRGGGSSTVGTMNIFGSAEVHGTKYLWNGNSTINFVMTDIAADKVFTSTSSGVTSLLNITLFESTAGKINIDLENFDVDGTFAPGDYSIALITASDAIYNEALIELLNADKMGGIWSLNGSDESEWLTWDGNTLYLNVTAAVPEPGTYACIAGAIALAIAAYRRRR